MYLGTRVHNMDIAYGQVDLVFHCQIEKSVPCTVTPQATPRRNRGILNHVGKVERSCQVVEQVDFKSPVILELIGR